MILILNKLKFLLKNNLKYIDYIDIFNKIQNLDNENITFKNMNIAILRSFTCDQLKEILTVELFKENYISNVYISGYNQYVQETLNTESELYKKKQDIVILAVRLEELYPSLFTNFEELKPQIEKLSDIIIENYKYIILNLQKNSKASILINNFIIPSDTYSSLCDYMDEFSQMNFIRNLNFKLLKVARKNIGVYIVDVEHLSANVGKKNISDKKMWYVSKNPYKLKFYMELSKEYVKYIKAISGNNKKCVVLDLDNTMWGGIVGENGFNGIKLDDNYPGICYKDFQRELRKLKNRGIILAINSKNNYDDAIKIIKEHPDMILRENDFANIKINWTDKATNIRDIACELNIGIDSMIFIDDNPAECDLVNQAFNGVVETITMPTSPLEYIDILNDLNYFETLNITGEDINKTEMYRAQVKRNLLKEVYIDLDVYYKSLEMVAYIKCVDDFSISRIAQLTQKTNQFNMTTRRYTEEDIKNMINSDNYKMYYMRVTDKFGDNGIVGVCIIKGQLDTWHIDTFLLSCRVMKRNLEDAFMSFVYSKAKNKNIHTIKGEYIWTPKNISVGDYYQTVGFISEGNGKFSINITENEIKCPSYIEIRE